MMRVAPTQRSPIWACLLCLGCAASTPRPVQPTRSEVVIQEATVVTARAPAPQPSPLPPLAQALDTTTPAFQCAFCLTEALLRQSAQSAQSGRAQAPALPERCAHWLRETGEPEPSGPGAYGELASAALSEALHGPPAERDVAVALSALWLDALLPASLVIGPAPAAIASDPALAHAYEDAASRQNGIALHGALYTLHGCVTAGASASDAGFAPWAQRCASELAAVEQRVNADPALASALAAHRAALRVVAAGERPAGPAQCWGPGPVVAAPAPAAASTAAAAAPEATLPPTAADEKASTGCSAAPALGAPWQPPPSLEEEFAGPWPRDHRYGPRDPRTGVRVSVALLGDAVAVPRLASNALFANSTHQQLAACFDSAVPKEQAVTVALRAQLSFDTHGHAQHPKAQALPGGDALATAAGRALSRCVQEVLGKLAVVCPGVPPGVRVEAIVCLRRESP